LSTFIKYFEFFEKEKYYSEGRKKRVTGISIWVAYLNRLDQLEIIIINNVQTYQAAIVVEHANLLKG